MKRRKLLLLFCSLALVHFTAQFVMLCAWLNVYEQDAVYYDVLKDLRYAHYLAVVTFPGSLLINALPVPQSFVVARTVIVAVFALNGVLWAGIICAVFWLCLRRLRPRPPQVDQSRAPANVHVCSSSNSASRKTLQRTSKDLS